MIWNIIRPRWLTKKAVPKSIGSVLSQALQEYDLKKTEADGTISWYREYGVLPKIVCFDLKKGKQLWEQQVEEYGMNAIIRFKVKLKVTYKLHGQCFSILY
jgi:hypothetical protein